MSEGNENTMVSAFNARDITRDLFSATLGSVCCCYTGQPFDTVKVRMQTSPDKYSSIGFSVTSIARNEGIGAFWKGAIPTAAGMVAENAVAFGVNEYLKRAFPDPNISKNDESARPNLARPFMMGLFTGCCSALVLLPSEIIKAKTQIVVGSGKNSSDVVGEMMKRQGMRSFFVGLDAQIMRDAPFYAVFFGGYEMFCYLFRTQAPWVPDEVKYFLSGGFAGMLGWVAAMPFDVPKTNVQCRWDTRVMGDYFPQMMKIGGQRGISGLYSGLGPTLARAFPANAALFLGVETSKSLFDKAIWKP